MNREKFIEEIGNILTDILILENKNPNLRLDYLYKSVSTLSEYHPELKNRPYAHWIPVKYELDGLSHICYKCNCCDTEHDYETPFCPDCGARMK